MTARVSWRASGGERTRRVALAVVAAPAALGPADDGTTAAAALARARRGEALVYAGDFQNARQLLAAMGRRLARPRPPTRRATRPRCSARSAS